MSEQEKLKEAIASALDVPIGQKMSNPLDDQPSRTGKAEAVAPARCHAWRASVSPLMRCDLPQGHDGPHWKCETTWTDAPPPEVGSTGEREGAGAEAPADAEAGATTEAFKAWEDTLFMGYDNQRVAMIDAFYAGAAWGAKQAAQRAAPEPDAGMRGQLQMLVDRYNELRSTCLTVSEKQDELQSRYELHTQSQIFGMFAAELTAILGEGANHD